jgi:DNA-binding transcriptional MerR regulator
MDKKTRKYRQLGDTYHIEYAEYYSNKEAQRIRDFMVDRKYSVADTNTTYRTINHWDECGLLPEGAKQEGSSWRKFTIVELAWLEAESRRREFVLSTIKKVKDNVINWDKKDKRYRQFEFFLFYALCSDHDPYITVFRNGEGFLNTMEGIENTRMINGNQDVLCISLKSLLEHFGFSVAVPRTMMGLTEAEVQVLIALRVNRNDEILIKSQEGSIKRIDRTKIYSNVDDLSVIEKGIRDADEYAEIVSAYQKGRREGVRVTTKKKF